MQTHNDSDFRIREQLQSAEKKKFLDELEERAAKLRSLGASQITGGTDGEPVLAEWQAQNGMYCVRRPDDEQGILRISVGGGVQTVDVNYCVYRGDLAKCLHLLRMAICALEECP